tara:strand:+ start:3077 stop:6655 length:3579 start_codon:yes stop_codon:yes gene_type:complete
MSKYILLECNRLNGKQSYNNIDENADTYKNKWVNNISNYGLVIEPGDQIVCENVAINTIGASDDTIEILGDKNNNGFLDNIIGINYAFYINDTGNHLVKLPLINHKTYTSHNATEVNKYITDNFLLNRGLGGPDLSTYSTTPADIKTIPTDTNLMPNINLVNFYKLADEPTLIGKGFRINGIYNVSNAGYTDYTFKVLEITAEGSNTGIPTKVQLWQKGATAIVTPTFTIIDSIDGGSNATTAQTIYYISQLNASMASRWNVGPTGQRFYFSNQDYTGPNFINYTGLNADLSINFTTNFNGSYKKRSVEITHEVPVGLNTPDNLATIMTDQLHRPTRLHKSSTTDFIDYSTFSMKTIDNKDNPIILAPPVITTPIYQPMPTSNGKALGRFADDYNSFAGIRKYFYSNIGWADPARIEGLEWSNQLYYGLTNDDVKNEINTGAGQVIAGDFNFGNNINNQTIGRLGLHLTLMQTFETSPAPRSVINYIEGGWVLTNAYFTEDTIKKIAEGFRKCERYMGDLNATYTVDSQEYKNNLVALFDIGIYIDELSNPNLQDSAITTQGGATGDADAIATLLNKKTPHQRKRFRTIEEAEPAPNIYINTDEGYTLVNDGTGANSKDTSNNDYCIGTVPFGFVNNYDSALTNDGQQLSTFVFNSRWQEEFIFDENDAGYQALYARMEAMPGENPNFIGCRNHTIQQTFHNTYTDQGDEITRTYDDLIALARKYNVACVPVFPPNPGGPAGDYVKFAQGTDIGRPFIAFRSFCPLGTGTYNILNGGNNQNYQIDARNCKYGMPIGLDPSFIRNKACQLFNTDYASNINLGDPAGYAPLVYMGSSNPTFDFDASLSRFSLSGLNTPMTVGNGLPTQNQLDLDATANPEQQVFNVSVPGQIADIKTIAGDSIITTTTVGKTRTYAQLPINMLNEDVPQSDSSFIDSYAGSAIESIILYQDENTKIILNNNGFYSSNYVQDSLNYFHGYNNNVLDGSLLGKMGWNIKQLLPLFGDPQGTFNNPLTFESARTTYLKKLLDTPRPQTTGAYISSAEYQPTETNSQDMPYYGIGINLGLQTNPAVNQGPITAQNLPSKLDYPYLNLYSSIISQGTDTEYYGSSDGKSRIPCLGYITRNNNQGDFFYGLEQSFSYTATKAFTLTEIETDIRLPNGTRPRLQAHNSVIYKITKAKPLPNNNILLNNKGK